ncbi:hypothetical protein M5K25_004653 [Dendrobium thyrsiflorum]|uniref:Uncharacterized protein n=1 Tax=Dendrobium thyrsiflorum TaxID=117978 RepID=A0ABD0VML6_DENTH
MDVERKSAKKEKKHFKKKKKALWANPDSDESSSSDEEVNICLMAGGESDCDSQEVIKDNKLT